MDRPLVAVFGATGRQGGALVQALLAGRRWRVRALTRWPEAPAAQQLAAQGANVCRADLDEPASLAPALAGAHAVYAVTDFWAHRDARRELRQAHHLLDALRSAILGSGASPRVQHLVWSTLEDTRGVLTPAAGQRFSVPHMDAKAEANAQFLELDLPVTLLLTSFYWENLIDHGMGPQRAADGVLELALPLGDARLPGIAVADIGHCAAALLDAPHAQRRVGIAGQCLSGAEMAHALAEALGEPVRWCDVPLPAYATLPFEGAAELAAMFEFKQRANAALCAARSPTSTRALHPGVLDFPQWLQARLREPGVRGLLAPPARQGIPSFT